MRYRRRMVALRKSMPTRMTLDEFLAWDPGDPGVRNWQLIDGEPVAMAPGSDAHGAIQSEVARLLGNHLLAQGRACRVVTEPGIVPRVRADWNYRVPHLGVTSPPSNDLMLPEPVLLIEILSPSNEADTRANIWAYATVPSVQEILAIRSTRIEAELLIRNADGTWPPEPAIIGPRGDVALPSIG
ncbi:MAG TPA: Uma2 family endonuclease, partial [Acetobacteraceae bacterium]|nr:Uma2 family endonuclease [Acetobacteraceae bacterium]